MFFSKGESLDFIFPGAEMSLITVVLQIVQGWQQLFLPSRTYFICTEIEAAIPHSLDRSLGPQETLYLHVCGLVMKNQIPGGQWG